MAWVRFEDSFPDHPKVSSLTDPEFRIWISAIAYCNRLLTDGLLPLEQVRKLSAQTRYPLRAVSALVRCGLLHDSVHARCISVHCPCTLGVSPGTGYVIHDYFEYQPTAASIKGKSDAAARAGRLGGLAKARRLASELGKPVPSRPVPTRPEDVDHISEIQKLEEWGSRLFGAGITGTQASQWAPRLPINRAELKAMAAYKGKPWNYVLTVLDSHREAAAKTAAAPTGQQTPEVKMSAREIAHRAQIDAICAEAGEVAREEDYGPYARNDR